MVKDKLNHYGSGFGELVDGVVLQQLHHSGDVSIMLISLPKYVGGGGNKEATK